MSISTASSTSRSAPRSSATSPPRGSTDVCAELARYAAKNDMDQAEARIRAAGPAALPALERALDDADIKIQFAAATLLFKLADEPTRDRVLSRFQARGEKNV